MTEEHKKKLSEVGKSSNKVKENIEKLREINKGNKYSVGKRNRLGIKHSEATKKKISNTKKGRGLVHSIETRLKMKFSQLGEKGTNWKGGITPENKRIRVSIEYRLWREAVFARDNFTCQKCEKRNIYLHPHHIFNFADYPELRFAIDNGITFCKECHKIFHNLNGTKNNNREQIKLYLEGIAI